MFKVILAGVLLLFSVGSYSEDDWHFSGFASLGAGRIYDDGKKALDYENEWSFNSDSVIGLQLDKELSEQWSFTGQFVANGFNYSGDEIYTPELEWLLLRFQPTGDMTFRMGRIRNPIYYYSATLEVGYTYPWVRPSANTYASFSDPLKHLDGIDFVYNTNHGDVDVEYQLIAGRSEADFYGLELTNHLVLGAIMTARWSDFMGRMNFGKVNTSIIDPATDTGLGLARTGFKDAAAYATSIGLDQEAEDFLYISNNLESKRKDIEILTVGFMWEPGLWTLMTEALYFNNEDNNFSNDANGFFVSLAYQLENYTPYITYGEFHNDFADGIPDKIKETEALIPAGSLGGLRAITSAALNDFDTEQETIALGVRYDFHAQANLKIEVEYFNFLKGTSGSFIIDDGADNPGNGLMTSIVIDVVF